MSFFKNRVQYYKIPGMYHLDIFTIASVVKTEQLIFLECSLAKNETELLEKFLVFGSGFNGYRYFGEFFKLNFIDRSRCIQIKLC